MRLLLIVVVALSQVGCDVEYGENLIPSRPWNLDEVRSRLEREKREFLKIEDLKVGDGPVAAWGRRLKADIVVTYTDGTIIYQGPIVVYVGFRGLMADDLRDRFMLDDAQQGIRLGLNGMAVGGQRNITIAPPLVCDGNSTGCYLLRTERHFVNEIPVHRKTLIVNATLTESCAPIWLRVRAGDVTLLSTGMGCRDKSEPKTGGADWRIY